ncbi:MAG: metal-dependent transcriptional regulator, partial [Thermoplasmata archaeon]
MVVEKLPKEKKLTEEMEEYIEAIYELNTENRAARTGEIAAKLKVAPASVTEVLAKLENRKLIIYEKYRGAVLTSEGLAKAKKLKRKHRLLERFLVDILGLKRNIHEDACAMEHTLSDDAEHAMDKILGSPTHCPAGSPIPPCECPECTLEQERKRAGVQQLGPDDKDNDKDNIIKTGNT